METKVTREQALALLKKYNQEPFHIQHALTVEAVMRWYAKEMKISGDSAGFSMMWTMKNIRKSTAGKRRNCWRRLMRRTLWCMQSAAMDMGSAAT